MKILAERAVGIGKDVVRRVLPWATRRGSASVSGSRDYWLKRYAHQGNSGPGSYEHLAAFKAKVLNEFVAHYGIGSIIEFGCGDGNQLSYAQYPEYLGFDISGEAVATCRARFSDRPNLRFHLMKEYSDETADLCLSLDVVFHLVEDAVFAKYMRTPFGAALRYVVVFSSNKDEPINPIAPHVRHRKFTDWVSVNAADWKLFQCVPNKYPYDEDHARTSFADFYMFEKSGSSSPRVSGM